MSTIAYRTSQLNVILANLEKDLLLRMIEINPSIRITPEEAMNHPYF